MNFALDLLGARKSIAAHWQWFAAAALALLVWHAIAVHDRAQFDKGYNAGWSLKQRELVDEQQSHAVTRTSLNTANIKISDQNREIEGLKAESDKRQAASADALKAAQAANKPREAAAKALDASAAKAGPRDAACVASEAFIASMKEL